MLTPTMVRAARMVERLPEAIQDDIGRRVMRELAASEAHRHPDVDLRRVPDLHALQHDRHR